MSGRVSSKFLVIGFSRNGEHSVNGLHGLDAVAKVLILGIALLFVLSSRLNLAAGSSSGKSSSIAVALHDLAVALEDVVVQQPLAVRRNTSVHLLPI